MLRRTFLHFLLPLVWSGVLSGSANAEICERHIYNLTPTSWVITISSWIYYGSLPGSSVTLTVPPYGIYAYTLPHASAKGQIAIRPKDGLAKSQSFYYSTEGTDCPWMAEDQADASKRTLIPFTVGSINWGTLSFNFSPKKVDDVHAVKDWKFAHYRGDILLQP